MAATIEVFIEADFMTFLRKFLILVFFFKKFFIENPATQADSQIKQGLEMIKSNAFFLNSQLKEIERFLIDY